LIGASASDGVEWYSALAQERRVLWLDLDSRNA